MTGYGRVRILAPTYPGEVRLSLDLKGSSIPPGWQVRSLTPIDVDTVQDGDLVAYVLEPAPGERAAELRRLHPFEPKTGGIQ